MGDDPFYLKFFRQTDRIGARLLIFSSIFTRSALAVTPSEKSLINTNRKSATHFPLLANYVTVVEDRPNVRKILSPTFTITNPPCSAVSLQ